MVAIYTPALQSSPCHRYVVLIHMLDDGLVYNGTVLL